MRIGTCIATLGLGVLVTATAFAEEHHGRQRYGSAGCGLGSMIIRSGGIVQIFSATTNGTSANQTFAITSGTSNCDEESAHDAKVFVNANRVALAKDISRGQGETIADLSVMAGCADSKAVGVKLQASFKTIFPNASVSSDQVADTIMSTLMSDPTLACTGG